MLWLWGHDCCGEGDEGKGGITRTSGDEGRRALYFSSNTINVGSPLSSYLYVMTYKINFVKNKVKVLREREREWGGERGERTKTPVVMNAIPLLLLLLHSIAAFHPKTMQSPVSEPTLSKIDKIHSLVASDVNDRGMKHLVVDGDFSEAAKLFARTAAVADATSRPTLVVLSGFPCLVQRVPPTETDGPVSDGIELFVV